MKSQREETARLFSSEGGGEGKSKSSGPLLPVAAAALVSLLCK